jgi:TatD DNase family protein
MFEDHEIDEVLDTIERHQIFTLSVSVDVTSFIRTEEIAKRSPLVMPGFGVHPYEAPQFAISVDDVEQYVARSPFIGEIGLDHRLVTDKDQYGAQRDMFDMFLGLAAEQNKFVNVHCIGAEYETLRMMRTQHIERAIIHWYSGPSGALRQLIDEGYLFTIGAEVIHSGHIRDVARTIPTDQLLTETDNPGGPEWVTGDPGHPRFIADVVTEVARVRGVDNDELTSTVRSNMDRLMKDDRHMAPWHDLLTR